MAAQLKDSGERKQFSSGAVRDRKKGKGRFDLIPLWPQLAYSWILEAGAEKYSPNNWRKGMPIGEYIDSAQRHLDNYKAGFRDEPHLWQALWNVAGAVYTQIMIHLGLYPSEFNDLYSDIDGEKPPLVGSFETERLAPYKATVAGMQADRNPVYPDSTTTVNVSITGEKNEVCQSPRHAVDYDSRFGCCPACPNAAIAIAQGHQS